MLDEKIDKQQTSLMNKTNADVYIAPRGCDNKPNLICAEAGAVRPPTGRGNETICNEKRVSSTTFPTTGAKYLRQAAVESRVSINRLYDDYSV